MISFESRREAADLYNCLPQSFKQAARAELKENRLVLFLNKGIRNDELIDAFTNFIMDSFEKEWLLDIIRNTFYFKDSNEQTAILDIVYAIFDGEKADLPQAVGLPDRWQIIRQAVAELLAENVHFSFQSIKRFRLADYRACLQKYAELSIDEYKLEQEYQAFVDKLRRIIRAYKPLHRTIYVIDDVPFKLYDERHRLIQNVQSVRSFYPLLKQWGIESEPSILLTLIGLAPQNVKIYTDRPEHGMMKTLRHVFEERVHFVSKKQSAANDWQ